MTYFDYIYQLAKDHNYAELKRFLEQEHASIDVFARTSLSPAGLLALNGHKQEAMYLLRRFGANENYIAEGFAQANNYEMATQLEAEHGARPAAIVRGAARAKDEAMVDQYLDSQQDLFHFAAIGYGQSGHKKAIKNLLDQASDSYKKRQIVDWAAFGAGQAGHFQLAHDLFHEHHAMSGMVVQGIARGGYYEPALNFQEAYRKRLGGNQKHLYWYLASGLAQNGDVEQLTAYMAFYNESYPISHNDYTRIAREAAYCGHIDLVKQYGMADSKHSMNDIAIHAAAGGHKLFAINLVSQNYASVESIVIGFRKGGHLSSDQQAIKLLALIEDRSLQNSLWRTIQKQSLGGRQIKDHLMKIEHKARLRQAKLLLDDFRQTNHAVAQAIQELDRLEGAEQVNQESVEIIRNQLFQYWQSQDAKCTKSYLTDLESAAYQSLKALAPIAPVNGQDPITFDDIPSQHKVFLASGHQYDVMQLGKWITQGGNSEAFKDAFNATIDERDVNDILEQYSEAQKSSQSRNAYGFFASYGNNAEPSLEPWSGFRPNCN